MNRAGNILAQAKRLTARRRRGSIAIEAVLVFPVILIVYSAVAQVLLLAQARSYVEHAAYAAARSALVYKCKNQFIPSAPAYSLYESANCSDRGDKILDAARWALVPAAAMSDNSISRGACERISAGIQALEANPGFNGKSAALENAICYAFEPENVQVTTEWVNSGLLGANPFANKPVRATVTFRVPVSTPFRRFVADGIRGDNTRYRELSASAVLM